jgi:hypothetical protein
MNVEARGKPHGSMSVALAPVVLVDEGVALAAGDHVAVGQEGEGVGDHEAAGELA